MRLRVAAAWMALAFVAAPAHAAETILQGAATETPAARQTAARALAETVQPREMVVRTGIELMDGQFVDQLRADPELAAMEAEYPGILEAMYAAARPHLVALLGDGVPELWEVLANVYAREMTLAEMQSVTAFYAGPTGQKVLLSMHGGLDIAPVMRDVMRNEGGEITSGSYGKMVVDAAEKAVTGLSPTEIEALVRFGLSDAGRKFQKIGPEVQRAGVEWMNRSDPEFEARVGEAMAGAVERHIEKLSAAPAE